MGGFSIDGREVRPQSVRKIELPQGQTAEAFLKANDGVIKHNFKDELFVANSKGDLFVVEDPVLIKAMGKGKLEKAAIKFDDQPAKVLLVDEEDPAHPAGKVAFQGVDKATEKEIAKILDTKTGQKISVQYLQDKYKELMDTKKFLKVNILPNFDGKGAIDLTVQALPLPTRVAVEGDPNPGRTRALFKTPLNEDNIKAGLEALRESFKKDPAHVLVDVNYVASPDGQLLIRVNQLDVPKQVAFPGLPADEQFVLKDLIKSPYNFENVDAGIHKIREYYTGKGQMLVGLSTRFPKEAGEPLTITFQKVTMPTKLAIAGSGPIPVAEIEKLVPRPLTLDNINKAIENIRKAYNDKGYVLAPEPGVSVDLDPASNELQIGIMVAKLGGYTVEGNNKTKEEVLLRELEQKPGEYFNLQKLEEGTKRIQRTGLFEVVRPLHEYDPESGTVKVRVVVGVVKEQDLGKGRKSQSVVPGEPDHNSFQLGLGYSKGAGMVGQGGVAFGDLGGMGRRLSVNLEGGLKTLGANASYYDPWAFGDRWALGDTVYVRRWQGPFSTEDRIGNEFTLGRPLRGPYDNWRLDGALRTETVGIDKNLSASGTGRDYIAVPKLTLSYSDVDDPASPHSGTRFSVGAGMGLGSATWGDFDTSYRHYFPLGKDWTLSLGGDAGYKPGDLPFYESFNSFNTSPVYGRPSSGRELGNWYAQGSARLKYHLWGPVSLVGGVTGGGIGPEHIADLGAGGGVAIKLGNFGEIGIEYGYRHNFQYDKGEAALNFNLFKINF